MRIRIRQQKKVLCCPVIFQLKMQYINNCYCFWIQSYHCEIYRPIKYCSHNILISDNNKQIWNVPHLAFISWQGTGPHWILLHAYDQFSIWWPTFWDSEVGRSAIYLKKELDDLLCIFFLDSRGGCIIWDWHGWQEDNRDSENCRTDHGSVGIIQRRNS